ncbi:MAG TPA: glycosyltransferase family 1 protein [Negativicutes bacterium]|nr:glycosyltransferase family 1 protein [Negativicutes bacterium]
MRIAIFTDTYLPQVNGVARTLGKFTEYLRDKDVPYTIFAPALLDANLQDENVHTFPGYDFFLYRECKFAIPNYAAIRHVLQSFKPTIVHITTPFPIGFAGLKYVQESNIPAVASYHTNFPQYLEYYRLDFLQNVAWSFLRWFYNHFARTYCPSGETQRLLRKHGIRNLDIWSRGVSTGVFHPGNEDIQMRRRMGGENKILLLYVGRLAPEKEVAVLFKALQVLNARNGQKIQLAIVGDGPLRDNLQAAAPENVSFLGYLQGAELAAAYASADIFVFPSVTETLGNVILEAMASGLPVVAPWTGGIKDNLRDMENGLACIARNHLSLANKISLLVEDSVLRKKLARQAHQYAKNCSWSSVFAKLTAGYQEVIDDMSSLRSKTVNH